ncbi:MAG: ABC transporter substrate-binding protein, partial [Candidatus Rokuibacteriota bacterium]
MRCRWLIGLALVLLAALPAEAQKKGGVLRVGILGEPPSLDLHWTTAAITDILANHLYEGLYTLDEGRRPIPMLAESMPTVSADGLTYTVKLRQGVRFHNGKELSAEDVVASLGRWGRQATNGKTLFALVTELRAADRFTVEILLKQRSPIVAISLAVVNNGAAIYPKEIAEKFKPQEKATEFVGTGPYRLAEWKPDRYIRIVRFDDYRPRSETPNGYGGAKTAWLDEIRWMPVPDVATRLAQLETGELDFADDLN